MNSTREWEHESARTSDDAMTTWTNPLDVEQTIEVQVPANITKVATDDFGHRRQWTVTQVTKKIHFAPGETKALPSKFDSAIHQVTQCGHPPPCRAFCRHPADAGPRAVLSGGLRRCSSVRAAVLDHVSLIARSSDVRSMSVAPADVKGQLADDGDDPTLARARARRNTGSLPSPGDALVALFAQSQGLPTPSPRRRKQSALRPTRSPRRRPRRRLPSRPTTRTSRRRAMRARRRAPGSGPSAGMQPRSMA